MLNYDPNITRKQVIKELPLPSKIFENATIKDNVFYYFIKLSLLL